VLFATGVAGGRGDLPSCRLCGGARGGNGSGLSQRAPAGSRFRRDAFALPLNHPRRGLQERRGWPPIQAISSRPGSSMRASHSDMPVLRARPARRAGRLFSTTALARKQCFPSLRVAVSRIAVATGAGWRCGEGTAGSSARGGARGLVERRTGQLHLKPMPVFSDPSGRGIRGSVPLTLSFSGVGHAAQESSGQSTHLPPESPAGGAVGRRALPFGVDRHAGTHRLA